MRLRLVRWAAALVLLLLGAAAFLAVGQGFGDSDSGGFGEPSEERVYRAVEEPQEIDSPYFIHDTMRKTILVGAFLLAAVSWWSPGPSGSARHCSLRR